MAFAMAQIDAGAFKPVGVEFIDENGGGPGVRLRKRHQKNGYAVGEELIVAGTSRSSNCKMDRQALAVLERRPERPRGRGNLADIHFAFGIPGIVRRLHTYPESGAIAEQFA